MIKRMLKQVRHTSICVSLTSSFLPLKESDMSLDSRILASDINDMIQVNPPPTTNTYHDSVCGSILYSVPSKSPEDVFSDLRHNNFDGFRRSFDVYHQDIIAMRNDRGQVGDFSSSSDILQHLLFRLFRVSCTCWSFWLIHTSGSV